MPRNLTDALGGGPQDWRTPQWLFDSVCRIWPIGCDVAASSGNALHAKFYDGSTPEADGLSAPWPRHDWGGTWAWCNPPFGEISEWTQKAVKEYKQGSHSIMLVPARLETNWWWATRQFCHTIVLRPRVNYVHPETGREMQGVSFASMLLVFGHLPGYVTVAEATKERGLCLKA
jgi:phage N-6-adenine-methyltransferase